MLITWYVLPHLKLTTNLWSSYFCDTHFTDEGVETKANYTVCPQIILPRSGRARFEVMMLGPPFYTRKCFEDGCIQKYRACFLCSSLKYSCWNQSSGKKCYSIYHSSFQRQPGNNGKMVPWSLNAIEPDDISVLCCYFLLQLPLPWAHMACTIHYSSCMFHVMCVK